MLPRGAADRHLDDAAAGAQDAEQQVDFDVEAVGAQVDPAQRRGAEGRVKTEKRLISSAKIISENLAEAIVFISATLRPSRG